MAVKYGTAQWYREHPIQQSINRERNRQAARKRRELQVIAEIESENKRRRYHQEQHRLERAGARINSQFKEQMNEYVS